ncbi:response regulator [Saccharophagus sp. K07]|uniref:hybrid sensor histidine kinase/response regulator n=1 Tax=Saccharophagus sp. K07 TaxID=2283636 RepID=UPI0016523802|nr:ATP-binding protein [Saccharophagus sp. K07]MBC6903893.1 response regulator [Saccharophagus sp. K07]
MAAIQHIFRIRRSYNQWVNNQTLEDYALRFTANGSRKWSLTKVANTALGAISFLALEAIGGAITLNYGTLNAVSAIVVVSALIFLASVPICYYASRYGVDIDLLTRGAGFGYIGSTATSLIYASFTFIFFALEAAIMAKALELLTGLPLAWGYVISSVIVIPMVFHGITFISRFQLWSQPLWLTLQILPLLVIFISDFSMLEDWAALPPAHQNSETGFSLLLFGAAASVMFALVAQIGEQVDFLRFLPEKNSDNRYRWWLAMLAGGPGWIVIGMLKLLAGSFLAFLALSHGMSMMDAADPTAMYTIAFSYLTQSPNAALLLAGVFVILSQLKINVTNAYAGSIAWSNFFSRLTHSHPGRVVWLIFNVCIALLLMELGVYHAFEKTLSVYAIVAVAWVGTLVADLVINKPLGLSPNYIEFKRAHLYDINPVGVGAMLAASLVGILAYLGMFGAYAQALAHFIALACACILAPTIALITRGRFYIARPASIISSDATIRCSICENTYERQDMAFCPAYNGSICSLCCSLDSRCRDACKTHDSFSEIFTRSLQRVFPEKLGDYINIRLVNFLTLLILVTGVTGILLSLIYTNSITDIPGANEFLSRTLWKVFFILMIVAGVISWLFVLAHESRLVAEEESQRQNRLLAEEIEAHKKTDLALQQAKETAEAANNAKSRYLTGLSHELRTPLNAILGYAQLLDHDDQIPKHKKHQIKVIQRSAEHLTDLIEGLLDISKIEAGRLEIQKDIFNLNAMMNQIVDMFRLQAEGKGLNFRYLRTTPLPDLVQGDEKRVRQILINLLSNAVKFTPKGEVELSIRYRNQVAEIRVRDTGVGIPENELERIFKPFERIRLPGAPVVSGTGLGLTITKLLVDIMGGDLVVTANPNGGVTFSVWLMLAHVYQMPSEVVKEKIYGYMGQKRSLLIVDDDPAHRGLMHDLLAPLGFTVVEAPDAESCLSVLKIFSPDAFLIDRRMPGINGPELARKLRSLNYRQPIIMVSANANEDAPPAESKPAYDDYLIKPIRLDSLLEKLGQHLNLTWDHQQRMTDMFSFSSYGGEKLPSDEILEEMIGWAEVGALGKIRDLVNRLEEENGASAQMIQRFRNCLDQVNLDDLIDTVRSVQGTPTFSQSL